MNNPPIVLVADDHEANRDLLEAWLLEAGYEVAMAPDGHAALDYVRQHPVDIVLLDVMMPDLDGFEVCHQIKSNTALGFIPVVLVTVLKEVEHRIHANQVSADDFLSKPINHDELLTRVKSLLRLKQTQEQLRDANQRGLAQNQELRQLQEMKEELARLLIHDLQNPLTAIYSFLELLLIDRSQPLSAKQQNYVNVALQSCEELRTMLLNLLDISILENHSLSIKPETFHLAEVTEAVMSLFLRVAAQKQGVTFRNKISPELQPVLADRDLVKRILLNLLGNALRFSPSGGQIETRGRRQGDSIILEVVDDGPGVPEEFRERIFEKFVQLKAKKSDTRVGRGLGLTFCKMAVEAHGGRIWVEREPGRGSRFCFSLPCSSKTTSALYPVLTSN